MRFPWFSRNPVSKEVQESRDRTEMEFALATIKPDHPCWEEVKAQMEYEDTVRRMAYDQRIHRDSILGI